MDHTPKKSKAVLITIIAILILLIAGYFIFKNGDSLFGTKNSSNITKNFAPLLGTSKDTTGEGTVTTVGGTNPTGSSQNNGTGTGTTNPDGTTNGTGTLGGDTGIGNTGGLNGGTGAGSGSFGGDGSIGGGVGLSVIPPAFNPIPTPDILDTDFSPPTTNSNNVVPSTESPVVTPNSTPVQSTSICPEDDPLVFTDAENVQLADLLRQYYLTANSIKTDDDIAVAENDFLQNKALIDQVYDLIRECRTEKASLVYTGPQTMKNNPYYSDSFNTTQTYVTPPNLTSPWIRTSEYYQSGYGLPTFSPGLGILGGILGNGPSITWPNAYYGIKLRNYKDFEDKFNIW